MELRKYISQVLLDVVGGVTDAQEQCDPGVIVPADLPRSSHAIQHGAYQVQTIDFEVVVRIDESQGSEGKIGVLASIIGAGVSGKSSKDSGSTNVLRFRVPVRLPQTGATAPSPDKKRQQRKGRQ